MNNTLLDIGTPKQYTAKRFSDTLMLFHSNSDIPFAKRAPSDFPIPSLNCQNAETVYETDSFYISRKGNSVFFNTKEKDFYKAVITTFNTENTDDTVDLLKKYITRISSVDPIYASFFSYHSNVTEIINMVAMYCGCLTDINEPDTPSLRIAKSKFTDNAGSSTYLAIALATVCLLYRRLSALRGLNFKLILSDNIPCLGFSAKIISDNISSPSDIPELCALFDIDSKNKLTVYTRLSDSPEESREKLSKLTLILCPQTADPKGILRAAEWKIKMSNAFDMEEIEIPGKF